MGDNEPTKQEIRVGKTARNRERGRVKKPGGFTCEGNGLKSRRNCMGGSKRAKSLRGITGSGG